MNNYFVIKCIHPAERVFYYIFDNEDLFNYSINQKNEYTDSMVKEAFKNEEEQRLKCGFPYTAYTEENIRAEFQTHEIHEGELSRIIGSKCLFFDLKSYTNWIVENKEISILEVHEGISC